MARPHHGPWPLVASRLAYHVLLWLYPRRFRRAWGAAMVQVFGDLCRQEWRCRGLRGLLSVWSTTLADLAASLPREHLARHRHVPASRQPRPTVERMHPPMPSAILRRLRRLFARPRPHPVQLAMSDRARFNKFTERARTVLSLAQQEAQRSHHPHIGTEHLLLGLISEGQGVAAKVLVNMGVDLDKARQAVEFIIGRGDRLVLGEVGLTPRSKKVMELAVDESSRMGHHYIGTEHLLLGLVREREGIAAGVLEHLGVHLEPLRAETMRVLGETGAQAHDPGDPPDAPPDPPDPPENPPS